MLHAYMRKPRSSPDIYPIHYSMLGSLTLYRRLLNEHVFNKETNHSSNLTELSTAIAATTPPNKLPVVGHAMAGVLAGWTVSFIAAPVEHVKARLQVQYAADKSKRLYTGPIDCVKKLVIPKAAPIQQLVNFPIDLPIVALKSRCKGPLPRPRLHPSLPNFLRLLVGLLRNLHSGTHKTHHPLHSRDQFLGRWNVRPDLLAHQLSLGCCKATHHDRSARTGASISALEGCGESCVSGAGMAGVLERLCAVLFESFPG